jgi:hypothetical protein
LVGRTHAHLMSAFDPLRTFTSSAPSERRVPIGFPRERSQS